MKIAKQSVELIDHSGSDLSVVNAARVSFHKESDWEVKSGHRASDKGILKQADAKLIKYLADHNHKSPFNHCFLSFRVKAPIFVARQLVKHEYLPWNEVSRRYVDDEPEFYFPDYWRKKADNVKQGSSDERFEGYFDLSGESLVDGEDGLYEADTVEDITEAACYKAYHTYSALIDANVCAEQARMILPQNMMTEWIWSGTLFAFAKMCNLRLDSHTQKETQEIAQMVDKIASELYPVSWKALVYANQDH